LTAFGGAGQEETIIADVDARGHADLLRMAS
jgi:hypothetical protein